MNNLSKIKAGILSLVFLTALNCGGGSGDESPQITDLSQSAAVSLKSGDIAGAKEYYDSVLKAKGVELPSLKTETSDSDATVDSTLTTEQAAFGSAFTRLLLLSEAEPTNNMLDDMGQIHLETSKVFGPEGILAAFEKENQVEFTINDQDNQKYYASAQYSPGYYGSYTNILDDVCYNDCQEQCDSAEDPAPSMCKSCYSYCNHDFEVRGDAVLVEIKSADFNHLYTMYIIPSYTCIWDNDTTTTHTIPMNEPISYTEDKFLCPLPPNSSGFNAEDYSYSDLSLFSLRYTSIYNLYENDKNVGEDISYRYMQEGTFTFEGFDNLEPDSPFMINFENVILTSYGSLPDITITSGTLSKTLNSTEQIDPTLYFPFVDPRVGAANVGQEIPEDPDGYVQTLRIQKIFGWIKEGMTFGDFQDYAMEYQPLLDEISYYLELADQADDFQFTIPKELFFGALDLNINRIDLKTIRASVDAIQTAIYLANSWQCDAVIGGRYNIKGVMQGDVQEWADELNTCFALKEDNHLEEARLKLLSLLERMLEADTLLGVVTKDGINDSPTAMTENGYAQIMDLIELVKASLESEQTLPYLTPEVSLNLKAFFDNPPSATSFEHDPFMVEDGQIKMVEGFVQDFLNAFLPDLQLSQEYQKNSEHLNDKYLNDEFLRDAFDEFNPFVLGGKTKLSIPSKKRIISRGYY